MRLGPCQVGACGVVCIELCVCSMWILPVSGEFIQVS